MTTTAPKIDPRDGAALRREIDSLRRFYTPEWTGRSSGDPGAALLEVFVRMLEGLTQRLNQAPRKSFIAFLDRIGTRLLPALPARVPLVLTLARGATGPVTIPAGSQAAGDPGDGGEPVVFETETGFVATPAALVALFHAVPRRDEVVDHLGALAGGAAAALFDPAGGDLQEHALYLGHDELFRVEGPARVALDVEPFDARLLRHPGPGAEGLLRWQYHAGDGRWEDFDRVLREVDQETRAERLVLVKESPEEPIEPLAVGGHERRFVRVRLEPGRIADLGSLSVSRVAASVTPHAAGGEAPGVMPETAFANDVELDLEQPFLPFGSRPRLFDTFYLASAEAFSKRGARVTLRFTPEPADEPPPVPGATAVATPPGEPVPSADLALSWEYWDGEGWRAIPDLTDTTKRLTSKTEGEVAFRCPADIAGTEVLGHESFWLRVRITSGDYGRERFRFVDNQVVREPDFAAPKLAALSVAYVPEPAPLQTLLTRNNLELRDVTGAASFAPFAPLEGPEQALYLGFDRPLAAGKGPFSFFFAFAERETRSVAGPRLRWEYLRQEPAAEATAWARLEVLDHTRGFTESGTVELFGPRQAARASRFGVEGYWLRALDTEGRFQPVGLPSGPQPASSRRSAAPAAKEGRPADCDARDPRVAALRDLPHPAFSSREDLESPPPPRLDGLFPNASWAVQAETHAGEILGSGTATAHQVFRTSAGPVIEEDVRVDELGALSEAERALLVDAGETDVRQERGEAGEVRAFRVRWRPTDDLSAAGPEERVYAIDRVSGEIRFGDGVHGRVPPIGRDNVRATYRAGGGARGNVAAGAVSSLRSTIPLVESVSNPLAAAGGADTEKLERALERGPERLRHRERAVSRADYEALAREASQAVARARCLPLLAADGAAETGWVTLVVVPESPDPRPFPSRELLRRVETWVAGRAPDVASFPRQVRVIGPAYVEVAVAADLVPLAADRAPEVELAARRRLDAFLHPLTGGPEARGWPFGRLPCRSDLFALLEAIDGLDHVENLVMTLRPVTSTGAASGPSTRVEADLPAELALPEYALVASGEHRLQNRLSA